jgi:PAS domain S-box-containing protein
MPRQFTLIVLLLLAWVVSPARALDLTPEEQAFLREHPVWRMAGSSSPPFQWMDEKGRFQGIGADYRAIVEQRLGVKLEPVPANSWPESLEQLRRRECDISLLTAQTPERESFLIFTKPLLELPPAIITRTDNKVVKSFSDLPGRRVAVARGWPIHERLAQDHPEILLLPRDDVGSAITAVALGDAEAYVGDLASATHAIDRLGLRNLKVAADSPYLFPFRIAVRKDWPLAVSLLDKAIATITPDEHEAIRRKWIAVRGGGLSLRDVLMFTLPVLIASVILLLVVNRRLLLEIAQRKQTDAALRISEERWNFALEGSRDGVWDWNVKTNDVFFSQRWKTMLGYSENEFEGRFDEWITRVHRDDLDATLDGIQRHLRGETADYEVEHRVLAKDGSYRWILARGRVVVRDEAGAPTRMVGTQIDVTERREAEEQLRREEEHLEETVRIRTAELQQVERRLREVTDKLPGAVYQFVRKLDGSFAFEFCSEGMETMVGVRAEEAVRDVNTVWAAIHPDDLAELVVKANHSAETLTRYVQDLRICQPDGRRWWIRAESEPQRRPDGSMLWNGNIMDITERKRLEEELAVAKSAAESANHAKSAFLANMSHEIRTPMNAILGFSQLMLRDPALTDTQHQHLDTINRSGEHLLALINDILEMSKIEAGRIRLQRSNFDLHALLGDVERMFRLRTDTRGLEFSVQCTGMVPQFVRADEGRLRQIFINLVSNAVKFTEQGGIAVRLDAAPVGERSVRLHGEVEDTGPGIAADELPRLFREFEQTETGHRAGVGTGLGLAISREFARLMGGDMTAESEVGRGTIFRFEMLAELAEAAEVPKPADQRRVLRLQPAFTGLRVLIADDTVENRNYLEQLLQPIGFDTRSVADGARAVEMFTAWKPQLVLLDLRMPVLNGHEAIRRIRSLERDSRTPIIAVTASAFEENRREVIDAGGDDFLGKPFREADLFEKIGRLTGASFLYADEATPEPATIVTLSPTQVAAALPLELRTRLREAALRADFDQMLAIIAEAGPHAPHVTDELRRRVEQFDYPGLLAVLGTETVAT